MSHVHTSLIRWNAGGSNAPGRRYSRRHTWTFDGGAVVEASSSPLVVPVPMSDPCAVDPEEAFVAALSSCHMLWFLDLASRAGYAIESYEDAAEGRMGKDSVGREVVEVVILRPRLTGTRLPDADALAALHHHAHEECYLANSVRCEVRCEPVLE